MTNTARLYVLIARKARKAVVFRRGPSKNVLLLEWDLQTDRFTPGHWFKGRIYERRCDLSPKGDLLVYFAAKHHGPLGTWTAISRPPYLTALALWAKGDAWGGGGLFDDERTMRLNHRPGNESSLASGFRLPKTFRLKALGERPGWGEDAPIHTMRLARDGWTEVLPGEVSEYQSTGSFRWVYHKPMVVEKAARGEARLRVSLDGIGERNGPWYIQTAQIVSSDGLISVELGRIDWADVDHTGEVLFAREGCLYRLSGSDLMAQPLLVADLNAMGFERRSAPAFATNWPKTKRVMKSAK